MTNFDFLKTDKRFASFADVAIAAENLLHIDIDSCVSNCRRAMEFAVKWMYSVDRDLESPYQDTLVALMNDEKFRDIVGDDIWRRMDFIRKLGNAVMHGGKKVTEEQAELCLENLYYFLDELAYFYADEYKERAFDKTLLTLTPEEALSPAVLMAIEEEKRRSREAVSENTEPEQKPEASKAPKPQPKPEPASAAPEKPAVDVDKLFESVLRQHGKIK